jgi:type I restriction enzyme S subunit
MTGWTTKPISEVIVRSGTIDPRKAPEEPFKYVDVSSISNQTFEIVEASEMLGKDAPSRARRHIQAGDVLFATIRPTLRRIAVVPEELDGQVCSTGYFVFRTKPEVDGRYLFYYLFSDAFMGAMETLQSGASYPAVNDSQVRQQQISLPPLPEQKRIVAILDEAFAGIDAAVANTEKNLANARELFESYLNAVFTQKGDGWVEKKLGELGKAQTGSTPKTSNRGNYGNFIPFIKPADFKRDGSLDYENQGLSEEGLGSARKIDEGSVLMVCIGATIGKCGWSSRDVTTNQQINTLTAADGVSHKFVYYQILTGNFQGRVLSNAGQATLPIINKSKWCALKIWLPQNINDQISIVEKLDTLQSETQLLETLYQQKLSALTELKQSILQKAFAGELTSLPEKTVEEAVA